MKLHKTDFSSGSVYRNILEVALPMTFAQILNLLYNIVDRIYIGRIEDVGELALTGVGVCFPIITLITAFTYLFGNGASPLFAMSCGEGNKKEAGKLLGNTFSMLLLTGAVITIVCYLFYKPILFAFGASDVTFPYAKDYILIYLSGTLFVMLTLGLNPIINAQGFGNIGMLTTLIGALINIVLDPVFIFFMEMGVKGAALATVISQFVSCVWVLSFLTGKKASVRLAFENMRISLRRVLRIMSLGVSGFTMAFSNSLVQIACNSMLSGYGDLYVGIMTVINSVRDIITMPVMGLTHGASPVMSFNYGEKAYDRVLKAIRFITVICIVYTALMWGIVSLFPEFFIKIFNNDADMLTYGAHALHIYFFGFVFMALQFAGQSIFVALGKSGRATFFSIFRKVLIVVPLTFILPRISGLGADGVYWAEPISNLVGGIACFVTMCLTVLPEIKKPSTKL